MRYLPHSEEEYFDMMREEQSFPMTATDEDRAEARNKGEAHPEQAWILSDRDVWHRNPFYSGPPVPHPEDEDGN